MSMAKSCYNVFAYIGLWVNDFYLYFDLSIYVYDKKTALKIAKNYNQKAIFDWSTKSEIFL